jgi:hypothetical protein
VLVFLDVEAGEPHDVIALKRQFHRFSEGDETRRLRVCRLSRCR